MYQFPVYSRATSDFQDGGMQMLWAAEIQARQFGCATGPDPFEQAQLPLLATMQFDGFMHKGWGMMGMGIYGEEQKKSEGWAHYNHYI